MKKYSSIIGFIHDNFDESVTLRLALKKAPRTEEELVSILIDECKVTRRYAESVLEDAETSGFCTFENGVYKLSKF